MKNNVPRRARLLAALIASMGGSTGKPLAPPRRQRTPEQAAALIAQAEAKRARKAKFRWNQYRNVRHLA